MLPGDHMQALNDAEMSVASDEPHLVMPRHSGDPKVVGWNRGSGGF